MIVILLISRFIGINFSSIFIICEKGKINQSVLTTLTHNFNICSEIEKDRTFLSRIRKNVFFNYHALCVNFRADNFPWIGFRALKIRFHSGEENLKNSAIGEK